MFKKKKKKVQAVWIDRFALDTFDQQYEIDTANDVGWKM